MGDGGDPQLGRAIQEVTRRLDASPPKPPARPAHPDRSGR
jgi:hypothetical protein